MKPNLFDKKISAALKSIRTSRSGKLLHVAKVLNMTECNYCKYEKGEIAFTMGLLKKVSVHYKINVASIILLAEAVEIEGLN